MKAVLKTVVPVGVRRLARDVAQMSVYGWPNPLQPKLDMSARAQGWLQALKQDGIVKIENEPDFLKVANYLDDTYFGPMEREPEKYLGRKEPHFPFGDERRFVWDTNEQRFVVGGTEISCSVSFLDEGCAPIYLNEDLIKVLTAYYGRQPYYRNQPLLQKVALRPGQKALGNGHFHVDHLFQISFMLLVTDVTEKDTHMEYCVGANRRNMLKEGIEIPYQQCEIMAKDYPIVRCTGKKGTLFVFDTSGFHRANYLADSTRKMLHLNITTGHNLGKFIDRRSAFSALDQAPTHVQRMFRFLRQN
jgi:hypothetical protein